MWIHSTDERSLERAQSGPLVVYVDLTSTPDGAKGHLALPGTIPILAERRELLIANS